MSQRLRTPSLARRVVVTALVLLALLLVVMGFVLDAVLANRLDAQLRDRLLDRAAFAQVLVEDLGDDDADAIARRLEGEDISVRVTDADGESRTAGRLPGSPPAPGPAEGPAGGPAPPRPGQGDVAESGSVLSVTEQVGDVQVELFADRTAVDRVLAQVRLALLVSGLVVLAAAAVVIGPVTSRALAPLGTITGTARAITAGDRGRRLRPDRPTTELGRTATAFDDMLDAVEGAERSARASEARLRDFVSDAAHELRTPVTGIRATAEHLLRTGTTLPPAEREQLLLTLVRESARAGRLVDDLLLMARIDRGLELRRAPLDLLDLAQQVAAARAQAHPDLDLRVSGTAAEVDADADRLQQVLANLVENAAHAGAGAVAITVDASGDATVVEVRDDGPGVPEADRERIFERLVRLDEARERRTGGAGLGLPVARGIVSAHGGTLTCVAPPPGSTGAVFRVVL